MYLFRDTAVLIAVTTIVAHHCSTGIMTAVQIVLGGGEGGM